MRNLDSVMDLLLLLPLLLLAIFTWLFFLKPSSTRLPPGPYPFPVIGNILKLGKLPHRSLAKLSQTYGPLMSLNLGSKYTVIVSSSDLAQQILTKHDQAFSRKAIPAAARVNNQHKFRMGYLPVGPQWRQLRKISTEQLFTAARLDAGEELRTKKVQKLKNYVQKCCNEGLPVNISEAAFTTTLNLMGSALFSAELVEYGSNTGQEFKNIAQGINEVLREPNIADFFPVLQLLDPQGIRKKSEILFKKMHALVEDFIHQRLQSKETSPDSPKKNDFMETLLDSSNNFSINEIAHVLVEFLVAGSDTTSATTEWAMTNLLNNPEKLLKVKHELRTVIGENNQIQESDFSRLPYFQAMIKEVFRYHTPSPFLMIRKSVQEVEVNGYTIPKGTQLIINSWAIARDPMQWSNPESFEPERFLEKKIDFKGQDINLLSFGAGRRMCPGFPLANRMLHMMVATLVHNFDWKFESSIEAKEAIVETFGGVLHKTIPLVAIPIKLEI